MNIKKVMSVLTWILIGIGLIVCVWLYRINDAERTAQIQRGEEIIQAVRPLRAEKVRIEKELSNLRKQVSDARSGWASVVIMVTEPDARAEQDILTDMEKHGYSGMMLLSEEHFPGDEQCLSVEKVRQLTFNGWELGLVVRQDTNLEKLFERVILAGLPAPIAVYFPEADCNAEWEARIAALEMKCIIQYRKDEAHDEVQSIWHVASMGSYETDSRNALLDAVDASKCQIFTVGYEQGYEKYNALSISNMMTLIQSYGDALWVGGIQEAYNRTQQKAELVNNAETSTQAEIERLLKELAEVERQINIIYYGDDSTTKGN